MDIDKFYFGNISMLRNTNLGLLCQGAEGGNYFLNVYLAFDYCVCRCDVCPHIYSSRRIKYYNCFGKFVLVVVLLHEEGVESPIQKKASEPDSFNYYCKK